MKDRLKGKRAVVTAAGQGIGRATAIAFASEGATVYASDINETTLGQLKREYGGVEIEKLDVTDASAVKSYANRVGGVDILFNCAGFVHHGTIKECSEDEWDFTFSLNVKSMYRMMREFLPAMIARGGGSVINMSSVASSIKGAPNRFVYGASKAAVIGMTKSVAADFVAQGIRCNAICPGTVQTPSLDERIAAQGDPGKARAAFIARQPMGRLGAPEEVAALAVYLAADESSFVTGTAQIIDGGWSN